MVFFVCFVCCQFMLIEIRVIYYLLRTSCWFFRKQPLILSYFECLYISFFTVCLLIYELMKAIFDVSLQWHCRGFPWWAVFCSIIANPFMTLCACTVTLCACTVTLCACMVTLCACTVTMVDNNTFPELMTRVYWMNVSHQYIFRWDSCLKTFSCENVQFSWHTEGTFDHYKMFFLHAYWYE